MSRWVVRWPPVPVSGPAPRARRWWSGRSARNYPHLVAERLNLELVDVTFSGATTAHVLADHQRGAPPQITALDGSESLVTVTIGGNDVGYVPLLMAASLPRAARRLPLLGGRIAELLDRDARDRALADVFDSLCAVGTALRAARPAGPGVLRRLPDDAAARGCAGPAAVGSGCRSGPACGRAPSNDSRPTRRRRPGCEVVGAAAASRQHHAWSAEPWTTTPARYGVPLPGRPAPLHPNGAGMRAVAELIAAQQ